MIVRELLTIWGIKVNDRELKRFDRDLRRVQKQARQGFRAISSATKQAAVGIAAATASLSVFLKKAGDFEQAQIAFETMLGSAERAGKLLQEITDFAAKTPFQLTGLIESSKRLLAFGFAAEDVVPIMNKLGNISAGVGKDKLPQLILALGQVRAATRLRGQELRQFTEAGVPLLEELAKAQGKTEAEIQKMVSAGKIGFEDVNNALGNLTTGNGRFANLMERQSRSFLGILSNIIDAFEVIAIQAGTKVLNPVKELAQEFQNYLQINKEFIAQDIAKFLSNLIDFTKDLIFVFKRLGVIVKSVARVFGGFNNLLAFTMKAFVFFISAKLLFGIGRLAQGFVGLVTVIANLRKAVLLTQASMIALPLLIGAAVVAAFLILEDLLAFARGDKSVAGAIRKSFIAAIDDMNAKFKEFDSTTRVIIIGLLTPFRLLIGSIRTAGAAIGAAVGGDFKLAAEIAASGAKQIINPKNLQEAVGIADLDPTEGAGVVQSALNFAKDPFGAVSFGESLATKAGEAISSVFNINIDSPINVPAGTDPASTVNAVKEGARQAMEESLRATQRATQPQVAF